MRIVALIAATLLTLAVGTGYAFAGSTSPTSGSSQGPFTLTITSNNGFFQSGGINGQVTSVTLDDNQHGHHETATSFTILNDFTLTATFSNTPSCNQNTSYHVDVNFSDLQINGIEDYGLFKCSPVPTLSSVSPSTGFTVGGDTIYITGNNLSSATQVTIGGNVANITLIPNDNTIVAVTPAGSLGAQTIAVTATGGTSTSGPTFTYTLAPAPTVTSVAPASGSVLGGDTVTITGTNFTGATSVTIGGVQAGFQVNNSTTITATTPAGTLGTASVVVTTPSGSNPANTLFTYTPAPPVVSSVGPNHGSTSGGTFITINGSHFTGATSVTVNGVAATNVTVVNDTTITAKTPAGSGCFVDLVVTTSAGSGTGSGAQSGYCYGTPPPVVSSVNPNVGPSTGGTSITISGSSLTGATLVTIGGTAATGVIVVNDTTITATTPAGVVGPQNIVVTTPAGTGTAAGLFTYLPPPPTVSAISPTSGLNTGGTAVTITGNNFTGATLITIGGAAATGVTVVNATTITATTPSGSVGAADVAVTTPSGTGTGVGLFTYTQSSAATVTGVSPATGSTAGGTAVTITGTNFTGATAVTFGGSAATSVTVVNASTITATTPAHAAGAVDVVVTAPAGNGTGTAAFTYVLPAPTVTSISPTSGPIAGGTPVTITGANFTGATAVTIGGLAATGITVVNATTITATTPAHAAGAVNVTVTTPSGAGTGTGIFTYVAPGPTVTSISPNSGPTTGGTSVTITGTNFSGATAVKFGSADAASFSVVNATQITATSPAGSLGSVYVTVTTAGGTSPATAAAQFTYSVPADSQKLRSMQVAFTPVIAQASGQAITGALDNAIASGFSGLPLPFAPNGSGFTYYFDPDRDGSQAQSDAEGSGYNAYAAQRRKRSRVEDAFASIDKDRASRARAQAPAPRDWLPWIDVRATNSSSHVIGNDMSGLQTNLTAGLTHRLNANFILGVIAGYEYFDYTSSALSGRLKGDGWTIGAYLGWRFAGNLRFDAALARSSIGYNGSAGTASATFPGTRWLASTGLTGTYFWNRLVVEPSARIYALWETEASYTDSLGTVQPQRNFSTGRASAGGKVSYPFLLSGSNTVAPYLGLYGDYYFSSDDASVTGAAATRLLTGGSARVTGGVTTRVDRGAQFSVGGELGGIGSNTSTWMLSGRGSIQF